MVGSSYIIGHVHNSFRLMDCIPVSAASTVHRLVRSMDYILIAILQLNFRTGECDIGKYQRQGNVKVPHRLSRTRKVQDTSPKVVSAWRTVT